MRLFLDSANINEIRHVIELGMLDGLTTNPALLLNEEGCWEDLAREICHMVRGPVSLEVSSMSCEGMLDEAYKLITFAPNVVVKVPMTHEGLKAVSILHKKDIKTNVTMVFSAAQALLAARAGAVYVSPFVGMERPDALSQDGMSLTDEIFTSDNVAAKNALYQNGMSLIDEVTTIYKHYNYKTQIVVARVRHPSHVTEAALLGAHAATIPYKVMMLLAKHPLTDMALEASLKDWDKLNNKK